LGLANRYEQRRQDATKVRLFLADTESERYIKEAAAARKHISSGKLKRWKGHSEMQEMRARLLGGQLSFNSKLKHSKWQSNKHAMR
jgi:hypothetical protein